MKLYLFSTIVNVMSAPFSVNKDTGPELRIAYSKQSLSPTRISS